MKELRSELRIWNKEFVSRPLLFFSHSAAAVSSLPRLPPARLSSLRSRSTEFARPTTQVSIPRSFRLVETALTLYGRVEERSAETGLLATCLLERDGFLLNPLALAPRRACARPPRRAAVEPAEYRSKCAKPIILSPPKVAPQSASPQSSTTVEVSRRRSRFLRPNEQRVLALSSAFFVRAAR